MNNKTYSQKTQVLQENTLANLPAHPPHARRFDRETLNKLDVYDLRILEELQFLSRIQRKKSPSGGSYAYPSELYLCGKVHLSRENVSRHVSKMSCLGVLRVTHRRKSHGHWQTNLYSIVSWVWWRLAKLLHGLRKPPHHVTSTSHIAYPKRVISISEVPASLEINALGQQILERWVARDKVSSSQPT